MSLGSANRSRMRSDIFLGSFSATFTILHLAGVYIYNLLKRSANNAKRIGISPILGTVQSHGSG
jgi:hypothetical protein